MQDISADAFIRITYKQGPVAANRGPATFIQIFREDDSLKYEISKRYRFISKEDGTLKDKVEVMKDGTLTPGQLDSLISIINSSNFMSLNPLYRDPDILDGDVESITLELKDAAKEVVVVNKQKRRFNMVAGYMERMTAKNR
jgi:hypothetical protein